MIRRGRGRALLDDPINYALTLEYLEAAFYEEAVEQGRFGGEVGAFAKLVYAHERLRT